MTGIDRRQTTACQLCAYSTRLKLHLRINRKYLIQMLRISQRYKVLKKNPLSPLSIGEHLVS